MPPKKKPARKHAHLHPWARIDRAAAMHDARVNLGAAYDLLEADADFGLHMLQQEYTIRTNTRPSMTSFVALQIFHRGIDLLDGLSVLVKAGSVIPMTPLVRSFLEAMMYARYLMTVNDERVAASYVVSQPLALMAGIEAEAEKHAGGSMPTIAERRARKDLEVLIGEERLFREARADLARLNKGSSVPVPWYQVFEGPRTLGGMSKRLNDPDLERLFEAMYDKWSQGAHVGDATRALAPDVDDADNVAELLVPLRSTSRKEIIEMVRVIHEMFLMMMRHQVEYFRARPAGYDQYTKVERQLMVSLEG